MTQTHFHIVMTGTFPEVWLTDLLTESLAVRVVEALNARFGDEATHRSFLYRTERGEAVSGWEGMSRETWQKMHEAISAALHSQPALPFEAVELDGPLRVCCETCGGTNVKRDAFAEWNEELQLWELADLFDKGSFCDDCGCETSLIEVAIDRASDASQQTDGAADAPPDNVPDIQADRVFRAVQQLYPDDAADVGFLLANLLGDLRHLADKRGLNFALCDRKGYSTYLEEKAA
ncbi:hypothetical protein EU803_15635 [Loktanella sp. IMCC34160]|uniref:hypothetical protein n=1 Tax=Loktanella sp. IMCC34160 TaxID=2510646 RepID=UPI00101BAC61|nr:hypothetical protein [Loktanella sp. IMCC34160]RYG90045.1 hypothetical protein EU803_15635 [Loktanella sp. IMCC34160]